MRIKAMMPKLPTSKSHYQKKYIAANIFNDFNMKLQNCETKSTAETLLKNTKKTNKKHLKHVLHLKVKLIQKLLRKG